MRVLRPYIGEYQLSSQWYNIETIRRDINTKGGAYAPHYPRKRARIPLSPPYCRNRTPPILLPGILRLRIRFSPVGSKELVVGGDPLLLPSSVPQLLLLTSFPWFQLAATRNSAVCVRPARACSRSLQQVVALPSPAAAMMMVGEKALPLTLAGLRETLQVFRPPLVFERQTTARLTAPLSSKHFYPRRGRFSSTPSQLSISAYCLPSTWISSTNDPALYSLRVMSIAVVVRTLGMPVLVRVHGSARYMYRPPSLVDLHPQCRLPMPSETTTALSVDSRPRTCRRLAKPDASRGPFLWNTPRAASFRRGQDGQRTPPLGRTLVVVLKALPEHPLLLPNLTLWQKEVDQGPCRLATREIFDRTHPASARVLR